VGAPFGNQNSKRFRIVRQAFLQELMKDGPEMKRLRAIADKVIVEAEAGEPWAIGMLFDRLEGRAISTVDLEASLDVKGGEISRGERVARILELVAKDGEDPPLLKIVAKSEAS